MAVGNLPVSRDFHHVRACWLQHILRERPNAPDTPDNPRWKADHLAVLMLSDVVWHYQPYVTHEEGQTLHWCKFDGDRLVRSYPEWAYRLRCSPADAYRAMCLLRELGLIQTETVVAQLADGSKQNCMLVEPVIDRLYAISEPDQESPHPSPYPCAPRQRVVSYERREAAGKGVENDPPADEIESLLAGLAEPEGSKGGESGEGLSQMCDTVSQMCDAHVIRTHETPEEKKDSRNTGAEPNASRAPARQRKGASPPGFSTANFIRQHSQSPPSPVAKQPKRKRPTLRELEPALPLVQVWERQWREQCRIKDWEAETDFDRRHKAWLYAFYDLLKGGHTPERIEWTVRRAFRLGYPMEWPKGAFLGGYWYLSNPEIEARPWAGKARQSEVLHALKERDSPARWHAEARQRELPADYESLNDYLHAPEAADPEDHGRDPPLGELL